MMNWYDRQAFAKLVSEKEYDKAVEMVREISKISPPFSSANTYSLVDAYALNKRMNPKDDSWSSLFSSKFIKHYRYGQIGGQKLDEINKQLIELCDEIGYTSNPREHLGISAEDKLIINDPNIPHDRPVIAALKSAATEIYEDYRARIVADGYPEQRAPEINRQRLFVAATKSDGFHPPHIHSNASFVMTYYFKVPKESTTRLQFGTHNIIRTLPFHHVVPEEGDFFIFPSCYMHGTTRAKTTALRANMGFEFEPAGLKHL